jgi:hypothetical protein
MSGLVSTPPEVMQRTLAGSSDTPRPCQSRQACLVNLRCISTDVQPPWGPPKQPVDIRDIIRVPDGEKAPWGYKEYLPGWFAPDITRDGPR